MCFTSGSRLIIHSPIPSSSVPSHELKKIPIHRMKAIEVMNPNPNTWKWKMEW